MKLFVAAVSLVAASTADSPVVKVVELLRGLETRVKADGEAEQSAYDKFACWCEDTTERKATAIDESKSTIEKLSSNIESNEGKRGTLTAELSQLKQDIANNVEEQKEAAALRDNERGSYLSTRDEFQQCAGALHHAVGVLQGAGSGKKRAVLAAVDRLSIVGGVRKALTASLSNGFPEHKAALVAEFLRNNPFGAYAPRSTRILGVLKDMYDTFVKDLEAANGEEATKEKQFRALVELKRKELTALQAAETTKQSDKAQAVSELAEDNQARQDTSDTLKADQAFFQQTKIQCSAKADEWANRSRLRTEELAGIGQAVSILTSERGTELFGTAFTELSHHKQHRAFVALKKAATALQSVSLASVAVTVREGHFDEIMGKIDAMVQHLRDEELEDSKHKDWCERSENANGSEKADLAHNKQHTDAEADRLRSHSAALAQEILSLNTQKNDTQSAKDEALANRNTENEAFKVALKDDMDAVSLVAKATQALAKFYRPKTALLSRNPPAPATWENKGNYGGRASESHGIVEIMKMIQEDLEKEIQESRKADDDAAADHREAATLAGQTIAALEKRISNTEREKASVDARVVSLTVEVDGLGKLMDGKDNELAALGQNCDWVKSSYQSRRDKRKTEMESLLNAKNILAGQEWQGG